VEKIKKFNAKSANYPHQKMVIVTEWEEFGAKVSDRPELQNYQRHMRQI